MKTLLLFSLFVAFLAGCLGGSFQVTGPVSATTTQYSINLPFVPNHDYLERSGYTNISDYYVHIEYNANIVSPIGLFVLTVQDQPSINGTEIQIAGQPFRTNDDGFDDTQAQGVPTITDIGGLPDMIAEIVPPINSVQGTQISLILTIENLGNRRPQTPAVEFALPGDFVDLIGASSNRPNVTINITLVGGDYYFVVHWPGATQDGAASDVDVTIDLFLHADACAEYAGTKRDARDDLDLRQQTNSSDLGNSSSSTVQCPPAGFIDNGDYDPACRPQPDCPDTLVLPTGACGGFCLQGVLYPDYQYPIRRQRANLQRNFVDKLTDDPTVAGGANPTVVYFFAVLPQPSSTDGDGAADQGEESSSENLVVILLPLFLGLLLLCYVATLIAALLAALWWFLTGREKMRTRVQWIPGRNKGGEEEDL